MRSRTLREGSVGLMLLLGLACFGALVVWLRGYTLGNRSYQVVVEFSDAGGMQVGAPVRYRGVIVGKISEIKPGPNGVAVAIDISPAELRIPRNVRVETNQSGLIGETSIDIIPKSALANEANLAKPLDTNCNPDIIICHKTRLQGEIGVSFAELMRSTVEFTQRFSSPVFLENINSVVKNTSSATAGITELTKELSALSQSFRQELKSFSSSSNSLVQTADRLGNSLDRTANQIGTSLDKTVNRVGNSLDRTSIKVEDSLDRMTNQVAGLTNKYSATADEFSLTASQIRLSASQVNRLTANVSGLIATNRSTLVGTLDNLSQTSRELRLAVGNLSPLLNRVEQGEFLRNLETLSANAATASARFRNLSEGEFIRNLEQVSANAVQTSANLRTISDPTNLISLQQTLDSARAVFKNAEKITSDLDELTGDPKFRNNIRRLVNGLSGLVSSTQQIQQQVQVAQTLAPYKKAIDANVSDISEIAEVAEQQPQLKKQMPITSAENTFSIPISEERLQSRGDRGVSGSMATDPVQPESMPQMMLP